MINTLIKLKILKLTMIGALMGGAAVGAITSLALKEMCKNKKSKPLEKNEP